MCKSKNKCSLYKCGITQGQDQKAILYFIDRFSPYSNMNNYSVTTKGKPSNNPAHLIREYLSQQLRGANLPLRSKSKKSKSRKKGSSSSTQNRTKTKLTPCKKYLNRQEHRSTKKKFGGRGDDDKNRTLSNDKTNVKIKQFVRKNQGNQIRRPKSKKTSKKSTSNQNQDILVEHLKAENQYYRKAYQASKESLERMERALEEERQRRSSQKDWFQHQITTLNRKLSADKIKLGHLFTYESFKEDVVSDMIIEVENQSSIMTKINPNPSNSMLAPQTEEISEHLSGFSNLSVNSK